MFWISVSSPGSKFVHRECLELELSNGIFPTYPHLMWVQSWKKGRGILGLDQSSLSYL